MSDQSQTQILEDFIKNASDVMMDPIHVAHGQYVQIQILNKDPKEFFGLVHDTPFSDSPLDIRKHSIKQIEDYYQFEAIDPNTGSDWRFRVRF